MQVYGEFSREGYTIEQALKKGWFQANDRKLFIRAVDYYIDEARPDSLYPDIPYSNSLLDNLPTNQELLNSQVEGVLSRDQLNEGFKRHSKIELEGGAKVQSIFSAKFNVSKERSQFTEEIFEDWRKDLTFNIIKLREQKLHKSEKKPYITMYRFLTAVPVHQMVDIILQSARYRKTREKVFQKNVSQGFKKVRRWK